MGLFMCGETTWNMGMGTLLIRQSSGASWGLEFELPSLGFGL